MLSYNNSCEPHSLNSTEIITGYPTNVEINIDNINLHLRRRQNGYGKGGKLQIKNNRAKIQSGVRVKSITIAPETLAMRDNEIRKEIMDININYKEKFTIPGLDQFNFDGILKYKQNGLRNAHERTNLSKIAIRVSIGMFCMELLKKSNVKIYSRVKKNENIVAKSTLDLRSIKDSLPITIKAYLQPIHIKKTNIYNKVSKSRYGFDFYAVPALSIICENIMKFFLEKLTGDSLDTIISYHFCLNWVKRG